MDLKQKTQAKLKELIGESYASKKYLLGVSGGKDSACLLHLFAGLIPKNQLRVVHVNYKLRGKDSDKDEALVKKICKQHSIVFSSYSPKVKNPSELHLRNLRRNHFKKLLKEIHFDHIVLAHHAQDQLETVLMRMIRGTGMYGISGIKAKNGVFLRPLLDTPPKQIADYLTLHKISYRTDASNASKKYFRNEVRHEIIPSLEKVSSRYGGGESLYKKITSLTEEMQKVNATLDKKNNKLFKKLVSQNAFWFRFNREKFLRLKRTEQERFLHLVIRKLKTTPDKTSIARALESIQAQKNLNLTGNLSLSISCGQVFLQNKAQKKRLSKIQGPLCLGVSVTIPKNMELRFPLPGDRFGSNKLKKKLLEERIPRLMRQILPVIAHRDSKEVVWYWKRQ